MSETITDRQGSHISISRRTIFQDLMRRYDVFIDGSFAGKMRPLSTAIYPVVPGYHEVRLAIPGRSTASSATVAVRVDQGSTSRLRTRGRSIKSILMLPLTVPDQISSLVARKPFHSRFYERPWIVLEAW